MSSKVLVRGELVFESEQELERLFSALGASDKVEGLLEEGPKDLRLNGLKITEVAVRDGRYHLKFEGNVDWPSPAAPKDMNYLDWLKSQLLGLVWDVEELKSLEVHRRVEDLKFAFYEDEELRSKKEEYNKWWMESASNITGLF